MERSEILLMGKGASPLSHEELEGRVPMSTGKRRGFLGGAAILAGAVAITKLIAPVKPN